VKEWEDDEDWLIAPVTPPRVATPVRPDTPPLSFATSRPLPIDPIMLPDHQITTLEFLPWIPPTQHRFQHSTYEIATLHVRADMMESIQTKAREVERAMVKYIRWLGKCDESIQDRTLSLVKRVDGLSDDWVADSIAISELQPRMTAMEERVQTLVEQGEHVADILDMAETKVLELRDVVYNYPHGQVDALRVEVDRLHGSAATMSQRVQILETPLHEARVENQDLRTRLSASKSSERCLINCVLRMDERISAQEQRTPGPHGSIMPPRRMNRNAIDRLVADHVATEIVEYEANWANATRAVAGGVGPAIAGGNIGGNGGGNTRGNAGGNAEGNAGGNVAPKVYGCTYKTLLACNPHTFNEIEGIVGLSKWFKKLESILQIRKCAKKTELKMMTDEYCLRSEVQKIEQELWNLTVKGDNIVGYTDRFHELAVMYPTMVTPEYKKNKRYIGGLSKRINGNVTSSKPATTREAIHMAHSLMDQVVWAKAARISDSNKRKWEDQQRGNNNNNNCINTHHHQKNRRKKAVRAMSSNQNRWSKTHANTLPADDTCGTLGTRVPLTWGDCGTS
nr:hypothetical protein [Tanacetum cinerariifolium]GEY71947.1 hypothetical protein [Tanacetum cinerariifolium]